MSKPAFIPLKKAATILDAMGAVLGRNPDSNWHALRYLWLNKYRLGCVHVFRMPQKRVLISLDELEKWRQGGVV